MNPLVISNIIGSALCLESVFFIIPLVCALIYGESIWPFVIPALIAAGTGALLRTKKADDGGMHSKEGFVSTGLTWIAWSLVGMLPFLISGSLTNVCDALFETISGFTTTGSSVIVSVEDVPKGVLMWRSFMHWIGGMGILVFMSAIMRFTGGSQMNLMKAESPGPVISKLVPKAGSTARLQYGIYTVMTLVMMALLLLLKMPLFDTICITFGGDCFFLIEKRMYYNICLTHFIKHAFRSFLRKYEVAVFYIEFLEASIISCLKTFIPYYEPRYETYHDSKKQKQRNILAYITP